MGKLKIAIAIALFFSTFGWALSATLSSPAASSAENLKVEARDDSISQEDEFVPSGYVLPNQIFNDGKPFYVGKDPVSGQLDFNSKKAGVETSANEVFDPKEKITISSSTPNFHDFLNLPVKYSSSKFVYPLVSSSYANLKYQGNNKNYISKKIATVAPTTKSTTTSPHYYTINRNITRLHIATTTLKPLSIAPKATAKTTTTTTTPAPTSKIYTTRKPIPSTTPFTIPTTTTTRKKFVPTKKYTQTTSAEPTSTEENRKPTKPATKPTAKPTTPVPTTTTTKQAAPTTTPAPRTTPKVTTTMTTRKTTTPQASIFPTDPTTIRNPVVFSESPSPPSFSPMPTASTPIPILDAGEVYHTIGQKKEPNTMSLADIFNSLTEEDEANALATGSTGNQVLDAQGNLMQPIAPAKPSPFSMHQITTASPSTTRQPTPSNQPRQPHPVQTTLSIHPSKQTQQNQFNTMPQQPHQQSESTFNGEYVQYQVQQPNVLQYPPTSNVNNVVISPGQQSATFVLGSQQTVGSQSFVGSVEKQPLFAKEPPVQYGTVINEGAYTQGNPTNNQINFQQIGNQDQTQELLVSSNIRFPANEGQQNENSPPPNGHAQPLAMHLQLQQNPNQVVFPNPEDNQNDYSQVAPNTQANEIQYNNENLNDVQIQKHEVMTLNQHQLMQKPNPGHQQGQQERPQQLAFPNYQQTQHDESLRPVQHMEPPHFYSRPPPDFHGQPSRGPIQNRPPFTHMPNGPSGPHGSNGPMGPMGPNGPMGLNGPNGQNGPNGPNGPNGQNGFNGPYGPSGPAPPGYLYNEFTRKPIPGINRPNSDRNLPNILPQFRPNAKLSQGHPTGYSQEPGNIRLTHPQFQKRPGSPQFAHRRQPIVGRYPVTRVPEYAGGPPPPPAEANRRIYRVSPYPPQQQFVDRNFLRRPQQLPQLTKPLEFYGYERHPYKTIPDSYQPRPELPSDPATERLAAFEEEDLVINDPPQPVIKKDDMDDIKLEPVVTLQMLKSQQKSSEESGEVKVSAEQQATFEKTGPTQGLYVVYPVKPSSSSSDRDINVSSETKEPPPVVVQLEPASTGPASEYQNTPFSVVRDQPQEPILTVKNKVHTLQQKQAKDKFPYPLEKPDSYLMGSGHKYHSGVDRLDKFDAGIPVAPRIVSGAYAANTGTEAPIAIAYTPTEPNRFQALPYHQDKFSNVNLATPVIREIRDSQTEDAINQDLDTRGQNFEKDFMAPFYPSMSLDTVTSSSVGTNGWNVYHGTSERSSSFYNKNNINRADHPPAAGSTSEEEESSTKAFELDRFQPELQGGFKPIYPPGYKHDEEDDSTSKSTPANDRPLALALTRVEPRTTGPTTTPKPTPTSTTTPSTTTVTQSLTTSYKSQPTSQALTATSTTTPDAVPATTTTSPPSSPKPTPRKKTPFETSLEALFFGDDEDFEDDPLLKAEENTRSSS